MSGSYNTTGKNPSDDEVLLAQCDELEAAVDRHFGRSPFVRVTLDVSSWAEVAIASKLRSGTPEEQVAILEQVQIDRSCSRQTIWKRLSELWAPRGTHITINCAGVPIERGGELMATITTLSFENRPVVQPLALLVWSRAVNYDFDHATVLRLCDLALMTNIYEVRCFATEILLLHESHGLRSYGPELMEHGFSPLVHSRRTAERIRRKLTEAKIESQSEV